VRDASVVVTATVTDVSALAPITAADAGAASGAPDIPRERVSVTVDRRLLGDAGDAVEIIDTRLPGKPQSDEDPGYRAGERYVLFLKPAVGPGGAIGGAWQTVSNDGRLPLRADNDVRELLPRGPRDEIRAAWPNIESKLQEAKH
jgi:hypothetical protein